MDVFLLSATHKDITTRCNNCRGNNTKCSAVSIDSQLNVVQKITPCQHGSWTEENIASNYCKRGKKERYVPANIFNSHTLNTFEENKKGYLKMPHRITFHQRWTTESVLEKSTGTFIQHKKAHKSKKQSRKHIWTWWWRWDRDPSDQFWFYKCGWCEDTLLLIIWVLFSRYLVLQWQSTVAIHGPLHCNFLR